jgi:hypothetical protein
MLGSGGRLMAEGTVAQMEASDNPAVRDFFARKPPEERRGTGPSLLQALEEGV